MDHELTIIVDDDAATMSEDEAMERLMEWMLSVAKRAASIPLSNQTDDRKAA